MNWILKHFSELSNRELYEILRVRVSVFVVEQTCPYQEIDDADKVAWHLWLQDEDGIVATARVLPAGVTLQETAIGRVIAVKRRMGLGTRIVQEAIRVAKEKFDPPAIQLEAQVYARELYEKQGFVQDSEPFLEDGIPHILMTLKLK